MLIVKMASITKHLVNSVDKCVEESLAGLVAVNPGLQLLQGHLVVVRRDIDEVKKAGKVTLVSGGGSGHEPAMAGYVGRGMLSAAVCGAVFASPGPASILAALRAVGEGNPAGTLLILMNYTGDRLNFGLAAERAKASGLRVEMVVVGEDCALTSKDKTAGRRGLCGAVLIHKIAGALAEEGRSLEEISQVCQQTANQMGTIGLSLSPCSIPGLGASFSLGEDEMELGLGIHGEAGVQRIKTLPAKEAVAKMLGHMTDISSSTHLKLEKNQQIALMVNNLGGTPVLEMNLMAREAIDWLEAHGVLVDRAYVGTYMTSLQMAGLSLTVLILDDMRKQLLDASTVAPAWTRPLWAPGEKSRTASTVRPMSSEHDESSSRITSKPVGEEVAKVIYKAVAYASEAVGNSEKQLNTLDSQSGDGDCGTTLKRGTDSILKALGSTSSPGLPVSNPGDLLIEIAKIAETSMGGSSGALYSLMFTAAASCLSSDTSPLAWCNSLGAGIQAVKAYGGAEPGDRTMLDSLDAAYQALLSNLTSQDPLDALSAAVSAAEDAAQRTAGMIAHAGRASYVSRDRLTAPDPGAHAFGIWLRAIYEACKLTT